MDVYHITKVLIDKGEWRFQAHAHSLWEPLSKSGRGLEASRQ